MDPDATLNLYRYGDPDEQSAAVADLREWIARGGYLPGGMTPAERVIFGAPCGDMHHDHDGDAWQAPDHMPKGWRLTDERLRLSQIAADSSYSAAARADARAALDRLPPDYVNDGDLRRFVVVTNRPGYLPESEPETVTGMMAALDVIRDEVERQWDDEEHGDAWEAFGREVDSVDLDTDHVVIGPDPFGYVWEITRVHTVPVPRTAGPVLHTFTTATAPEEGAPFVDVATTESLDSMECVIRLTVRDEEDGDPVAVCTAVECSTHEAALIVRALDLLAFASSGAGDLDDEDVASLRRRFVARREVTG